ncbi:MAG TPA: phytanoyl-CoA dioxygenase family protein [Nitriliruptorales bacterium]
MDTKARAQLRDASTRSGSHLSPADHQHFLEHGWVLVKGLLPPDVVQRALDVFVPAETGMADTLDLTPDARARVFQECMPPAVHEAVAELFGDVPFDAAVWHENKYRPHEPEAEQQVGAHMDLWHPTVTPDRIGVACFGFLTDVRPGGGCFMYVPRSPLSARHVGVERGGDSYWGYAISQDHDDELVELVADAGDVFLYTHHIVHSGSKNLAGPHARHAFVTQFMPQRRIVPGERPLEELSTVEKAFSLRYLSTLGYSFRVPAPPLTFEADAAISHGLGSGGGIVAATASRFDGTVWFAVVDHDEPCVVKLLASADLVAVEELGRLEFDEEVLGVQTDARYSPLLLVATRSGTRFLASEDHVSWQAVATVPGVRCARPHFCLLGAAHDHVPDGQSADVLIGLHDGRAELRFSSQRVPVRHRRNGAPLAATVWGEVAAWENQATFFATDDVETLDVQVLPINEGLRFGLVADVREEAGAVGIHVAVSATGDRYTEGLTPLATDAPTRPRNLRLFERARGYWLVTYLRDHEDGARLHWGTIDWDSDAPILHEVPDAAGLRAALEEIGLR